MNRSAIIFSILVTASLWAQENSPSPADQKPPVAATNAPPAAANAPATPTPITTTTMQKRGVIGRVFHPFSSGDVLPKYNDKRLRGLVLDLQVSPQPVRLSEVRQIEVKLTVTNKAAHVIQLDFQTDQRIEIQLLNAGDVVLTKWSENHAAKEKPSSVLINPDEHVEYKETIATRDLAPGKVFTAEVFFPKYPDLKVRQKFLTEP